MLRRRVSNSGAPRTRLVVTWIVDPSSPFFPVVEATLGALGTPSLAEQAVSPDAERVLGRPPRTFAEWVARNAAAFR